MRRSKIRAAQASIVILNAAMLLLTGACDGQSNAPVGQTVTVTAAPTGAPPTSAAHPSAVTSATSVLPAATDPAAAFDAKAVTCYARHANGGALPNVPFLTKSTMDWATWVNRFRVDMPTVYPDFDTQGTSGDPTSADCVIADPQDPLYPKLEKLPNGFVGLRASEMDVVNGTSDEKQGDTIRYFASRLTHPSTVDSAVPRDDVTTVVRLQYVPLSNGIATVMASTCPINQPRC